MDDPRFGAWNLKYIFAMHNHPFGGPLSREDMLEIISFANEHEWVVETKDGKIPIAIIAFFSKSDPAKASCDGFYQYTPETRELQQFTKTRDGWLREDIGKVTWIDSKTYRLNGIDYH